MARLQKSVVITNKLGLHARPATRLAQLCQKFSADVTIELDEKQVDASSIMGLMLLAACHGKVVTIITEGKDAEQALSDVCQLFCDKFEEDE